ncbi:unnamed protein product [Effrenium voratum]|nr:unnamed protein product [Effrenium voratum]
MLTPPSRHLKVMQQDSEEKRELAAERRGQAWNEQAAKANAEGKRQHLSQARKEREAYLAYARRLFHMEAAKASPAKEAKEAKEAPRDSAQVAAKQTEKAKPNAPKPLPGPLQRNPLRKLEKPKLGGWSEVSTAAPSTIGDEKDGLSTARSKHEVGFKLQASLKNWLESDRGDDSAGLAELETALAEQVRERDPLDETLSSSDESLPEVKAKRPPVRPVHQAAPQRPRIQRSASSQSDRSKRPKAAARKRSPASGALKGLLQEEEALQKSLLRMDFEEMKRQFGGQKPMWREDEALGDSFKKDPLREAKLEASLQRLDGAFQELQMQREARQANAMQEQKVEVQKMPRSSSYGARVPTIRA